MRDDHAFVKVESWSASAFCAVLEKVWIKTGQYEELVGALDMQEKALVTAGTVDGAEVVMAVEAFHLAFRLLPAAMRSAAEVSAHNGDVVRHGDLGNAHAFESVAHDDEKEQFSGKQGSAVTDDEVLEEFGVIENEGDGVRISTEVGEASFTLVGQGECLEDEVPIRLSETEPTAWTREVCHCSRREVRPNLDLASVVPAEVEFIKLSEIQ